MLKCASNCTARAISISLPGMERGSRCSKRAVCMVKVEPPDTMRPFRIHWSAARASDQGTMPGWRQKKRSSVWISRDRNAGETSRMSVRSRHTPPGAGKAASSAPCRSFTSADTACKRCRSGGKTRSSATHPTPSTPTPPASQATAALPQRRRGGGAGVIPPLAR